MSWNLRQIAVPMPPIPPVTYASLPILASFQLIGCSAFHRQCHTHAAADAKRRQPLLRTVPLHLMQQAHQDATSGRADGMAERDRTTVDVDLRGVPTHLLVDGT